MRARSLQQVSLGVLSAWRLLDGSSPCLLLIAAFLVLAGAGAANAQEVRVAWDQCADAGSANKVFSCSTNTGSEALVISCLSPFPKLGRADISMHVCFSTDGVPDWWQLFGAGSCRQGALTVVAPTLPDNCSSIWNPSAGSIQSVGLMPGTTLNGFRFLVSATGTEASGLVAGQQYAVAKLVLDHAASAGSGACAGCTTGASIGIDFAWFYATDGQAVGTSLGSHVTWQDASLVCVAVTPVRNQTWGHLKSLYR